MPSPDEISRLRADRDAALAAAAAAEDRIRTIDAALSRAGRAGRVDEVARLEAARAEQDRLGQRARADYTRLHDAAFGELVQWLDRAPEESVARCTDAFPFVLLPVRIETKFARVGSNTELRVRFFPDDIGIAPPLAAPGDTERALGFAYWRARSRSRHAPGDATAKAAYGASWTALASTAGPYRASYLVAATRPTNPDGTPDELIFSDSPVSASLPIARAEALPDRFVVLLYRRDPTTRALNQVGRAVGAPIADNLVLAPAGEQPESWLTRNATTGHLEVPDALRWLVDFDHAVSVGMALRVPLTSPFDVNGFDRVIAVGVRSATPAQQGPALVESVLTKHRYSHGCGLVGAGTPTNNTESAASGSPSPADEVAALFAIEDTPPELEPGGTALETTDGWRLAQLFGLGTEFVRRMPNASSTDVAEALAMNRALAPGTLDDFVAEFLKGIVSPQTAADLHRFFVTWVSGRGHYPAIRVGRQPYGIVVTSAWGRWSTEDHTPVGDANLASKLFTLIGPHRFRWQRLAERAPHVAQRGADPFARLVGIVGLLASSTKFVSRKAVSDEYIRQRLAFGGAHAGSTTAWFNELRRVRDGNLAAVQFPAAVGATDPLLAFLVFLRETSDWRLPLVDRDPKVPLSETAPVGTYDGVHNYLWWLTQASRADLGSERFVGSDGATVARPTALLYVLLRHALLAALESSSLSAATIHGAQQFSVVERDPLIVNIGDEQHIQRRDYLEVDASRLGLSNTRTSLADWVLAGSRRPTGDRPSAAERLAEVQDAVTALAGLPTARLERLLTEHVDLCSYRLDAWITGFYLQRLELIRTRASARGLHLGAFGWVENLRPATGRTALGSDSIPVTLREGLAGNVFEDSRNGGFIHAPSLAQATSAAVLRNGYLSHASPDLPRPFAVNLSSARMRDAIALTTGVREGQPIAALLGYQFERGLHEGHPGLELDQFIFVLRDRFPLLSGRISEVPPGTSAERIEARNVVDGLGLADATRGRSYPYGITGLPAPGAPLAAALAAEVDRLHDALDATSDLLIAESVHQAVQGNLSRTLAAQQALTSPAIPPDPDVIRTPRSGRVLAFRAAIALDAEATSGWHAPLTPRAEANAQLNHWLLSHLPPPDAIEWTAQAGSSAPVGQAIGDLGLEPLDVVLMSGDQLGDSSSELERYIVRRFAAMHPADESLEFDFAEAPSGGTSLAKLQPLLSRLRRVITSARAAHAADWRRAADAAHGAAGDPTGSATGHSALDGFDDLTHRLESVKASLEVARHALIDALAAAAPLQAALVNDPSTVNNPEWVQALDRLRDALFALVLYGVPEAVPADGHTISATLIDRLLTQARIVSTLAGDRLAKAGELLSPPAFDVLPAGEIERVVEVARRNGVLRERYLEAARALLGPTFVMVPLFAFTADQAAEIGGSLTTPPASAGAVEEWVLSLARVRPRMADLAWMLAASRWTGRPIADPTVVQLPHQPGAPWIGGTFGSSLAPGECLSLLVIDAVATSGALQAGLLIDEWTETVPVGQETTGVAFNFDRPNAVAPQALLVAVPPELRGHWVWDDLVGSIHEALDLAAIRAVEPDALLSRSENAFAPSGDYFQVLPAILAEFTTGRVVTADFAARVAAVVAQLNP
jgi:hypothetical protein